MKSKLNISLLAIILFSTLGCNKDFLKEKPLSIIAHDNLFVDKEGFEAG